mgnify:CR=1 FL=1
MWQYLRNKQVLKSKSNTDRMNESPLHAVCQNKKNQSKSLISMVVDNFHFHYKTFLVIGT